MDTGNTAAGVDRAIIHYEIELVPFGFNVPRTVAASSFWYRYRHPLRLEEFQRRSGKTPLVDVFFFFRKPIEFKIRLVCESAQLDVER